MPDQSSAASEHAILQEITAPLETLPDDPLSLVEAEFPTVMRGYDRHAVDEYVEQMTRLVAELHATRSPEAAVRRALERVGDQISGVLQRAHETAEQITAQSRVEAEDRLERARREGASLIEAAERRVRELDADADRVWGERQRIIADAEELSGQLLAVARDAVARFPEEESRPGPILDHLAESRTGGDTPAVDEAGPFDAPEAFDEPEASEEPEAFDEPEGFEERGPFAEPELFPEPEEPEEPGELEQSGSLEDPEAGESEAPGHPPEAEADADADDVPTDEDQRPPAFDPAIEDPTLPIEPTERYTLSPQDESTRIIPPASDAAQRRRDG